LFLRGFGLGFPLRFLGLQLRPLFGLPSASLGFLKGFLL
jgi:hypothetical protein